MFGFAALFILLSAVVPLAIQREMTDQMDGLWWELFTPRLLVPALALLLVYYTSDGLRLWFTLRALGQRQPLRSMFPLVFINMLFSNVTPMATGGGVVQVWHLYRRGVHIGAATAATTLRTLLASLIIFVPTPVLLLSLDALEHSPLANQWVGWFGLLAAFYVVFFVLLLLRMRWFIGAASVLLSLAQRLRIITGSRRRRWQFRLCREMLRFGQSFRAFFKGSGFDRSMAILCTLVFLVSLFSFPALLLWGLGYAVDYPMVLALMLINTFVMYFAPTPGAAGVAEGVFALLFTAQVEARDLLLLVLGWRFLTIHMGMLIGVPVALYSLGRRGSRHA